MAAVTSKATNDNADKVEDNCDLKEVNVFDEHEPFVWGLGCRDNRSLNFYVLDLVTQWSLVQKLDLDNLLSDSGGRRYSSGYRVISQMFVLFLTGVTHL